MKNNKILIIPLLLLMAALLLLFQPGGRLWQSFSAGRYGGGQVIATINGEELCRRDLSLYGSEPQEARLNCVMQELLYREAVKQGFTPHREQVAADLRQLRQVLAADPVNYGLMLEELAAIYGPGLGEDEYWSRYEDELVRLELARQYWDSLEAAYLQEHGDDPGADFQRDFMQLYGNDLLQKYRVVIK
ncbi:MAG: hypothetical protein IJI40_03765 [Firmicutes bacterium]|nr:hypothetical protein [Bacillota bacterium]MBQ6606429.1 hypothetical protein [Bacillota bacterium]